MLSSKHTWQKESVPVSVSSLQMLQMLSSFRSMFTKCSSSSMVFLQRKQNKHSYSINFNLTVVSINIDTVTDNQSLSTRSLNHVSIITFSLLY